MNYDQINKIYDYWKSEISPFVSYRFAVLSFEDYLKKMAFTPSGDWLRYPESVYFSRLPFLVDPHLFVEKYKDKCVTSYTVARPEDGYQRIIYQLSPKLHVDAAMWIWIEPTDGENKVQSYLTLGACFFNRNDFLKLQDELEPFRRTGDTLDKKSTGFANMGFLQSK